MGTVQLMSDRDVARQDMFKRVIKCMEDNVAIVVLQIALGEETALLSEKNGEITAECIRRNELKTSTKDEKPDSRAAMASLTYSYSRTLHALGRKKNIFELLNMSKDYYSSLVTMRYNPLGDKATEILGLLNKYKTDMIKYDITQEIIDDYESLIAEYKSTITDVDASHGDGVGATKDLEALFMHALNSIYIIDDIMEGIELKHPAFYNSYKAARNVFHFGVRHKKKSQKKGNSATFEI
ncbi:MAG: hypothetical protein WCJ01_10330 [Ignavibacteria bacterium]